MKTTTSKSPGSLQSVVRARRIYACLDACATLETAAQAVLRRRQSFGEDDATSMKLLEECREKARSAREDADAAMHEMGIGYHQIYGERPNNGGQQ